MDPGKQVAKCDECHQNFFNRSSLRRHMKRIHASHSSETTPIEKSVVKNKKVKCKECYQTFFNGSSLRRHMKRIHTFKNISCIKKIPVPVEYKLMCDTCDQIFGDQRSLTYHISTTHDNEGIEITKNVLKDKKKISNTQICDEGDQDFQNKSNLNHHKKKVHHRKEIELVCHLCCKSFSKKSNLKRHNYKFHPAKKSGKEHNEKLICEECGQSFYDSSNLRRHQMRFHVGTQIIRPFKCDLCVEKFPWKKLLAKHMFNSHGSALHKKEIVKERCDKCDQSFHNKRNLLRHEESIHQTILFECSACDKIFRRKDSLIKHIQYLHASNREELRIYECFYCSKKFHEKHLTKRHIFAVHINPKPKASNFNCMKCDSSFPSRNFTKAHYEKVHGIQMEYEELEFESVENFDLWKTELQRSLVTQFAQQCKGKTSAGAFRRYICHRSGRYRDLSKNQPRKRQLKNTGSKKLQGYCPAEIVLRVQGGRCFVQFQRTHVGHEISTAEELRHIYLDKELKKSIASKLLEGVPRTEILKKYHSSNGMHENLSRLSILNSRDIYNISQNIKIAKDETISANDEQPVDVDSFIIRKDSILFNKNKGEEDSHFGLLNADDFVIILMDQGQAENLHRYGPKIVAFDGTYGLNSFDFVLHTMLVSDINYEVIPVAFLLTNRNDQPVIDIFIKCLRDRVGVIRTKALMSDTQSMYYNSWINLMEPPQFYLFCAWHVNEVWRRHLNKISDKNKRSEVSKQLLDLEQELDEALFEQKLTAFLLTQDDDLFDFVDFFRMNFFENTKQWAYCHRKCVGVTSSMRIEDFHRVLKQNISDGKKITTSFEGLKYLEEFLIIKDNERITKELRGGHLNKRENLKKNHQLGAQSCEENVVSIVYIDDLTWQIVSFQNMTDNVAEIYTIERLATKECALYSDVFCQLVCNECKICSHEYRCTCLVSSIHLNMCQHIHILGLYLQTHQLLELKGTDPANYCDDIENFVEIDTQQMSPSEAPCINVENSNDDDVEKIKLQILEEVQEALNFANELPDLELIRKRFVQPMKLKLMDGKT